jgi:hypothetical protein
MYHPSYSPARRKEILSEQSLAPLQPGKKGSSYLPHYCCVPPFPPKATRPVKQCHERKPTASRVLCWPVSSRLKQLGRNALVVSFWGLILSLPRRRVYNQGILPYRARTRAIRAFFRPLHSSARIKAPSEELGSPLAPPRSGTFHWAISLPGLEAYTRQARKTQWFVEVELGNS